MAYENKSTESLKATLSDFEISVSVFTEYEKSYLSKLKPGDENQNPVDAVRREIQSIKTEISNREGK